MPDSELNTSLLDIPTNRLGLLGGIADFIYSASPHPNKTISLTGALTFMANVTGRAFNTWTHSGCNLYMMLLATTGKGKEAATSGRTKLMAAVQQTVPCASEFTGPNLVSAAGAMKALEKRPSMCVNIAEAGYRFKSMCGPRVSSNDEMLKAFLLDVYGKSGFGNVMEPNAYSDPDKNSKLSIISPAPTIFAESIPEIIFEAADERMIASGLLSRFVLVEAQEPRSPLVDNPLRSPAEPLIQIVADLVAVSAGLNARNTVVTVYPNTEAKDLFRAFSDFITDEINRDGSNITKELWNRAWLNAQKIACILAISANHHTPTVTHLQASWATNFVVDSVKHLISKFDKGEVGTVEGNENKQVKEVLRAIKFYMTAPWQACSAYNGTEQMHRDGVITKAHITQRLSGVAAFRNEREKPSVAIKRILDQLVNGDELRQVPAKQMLLQYGRHPEAYAVSDPTRFVSA